MDDLPTELGTPQLKLGKVKALAVNNTRSRELTALVKICAAADDLVATVKQYSAALTELAESTERIADPNFEKLIHRLNHYEHTIATIEKELGLDVKKRSSR